MSQLEIRLLGPFQASLNGSLLTNFESNKVRALLAYLAVEADCPHRREKLASLFWPEMSDRAARNNLRYALSDLRSVIGDRKAQHAFLRITTQDIQFDLQSNHCVDVRAFQAYVEEHSGNPSNISALESGLSLSRGPFLEGFSLPDSIGFEDWLQLKRQDLNRLAARARKELANYWELRGDYERAESWAAHQLAIEPGDEEMHRQLMRIYSFSGRRSAAIAQFEICRKALKEDLDVAPSIETYRLYQEICDDKVIMPSRPPVFLSSEDSKEEPPPIFIARDSELMSLRRALDESLTGDGQIFFITGEPGVGKTALALEFSRRAQQDYPRLAVARGSGQDYFGIGEPYLPFKEVLEMLTGDVENRWAAGHMTREHSRRLWSLAPRSIRGLVENGPSLINTFIDGASVLQRGFLVNTDRPKWLMQLQEKVQTTQSVPGSAQIPQQDYFGQYHRVLRSISQQAPLLILLDDLQWADQGSLALLFALARELAGSRIMILGAYRSAGIQPQILGNRPSLASLANELKRIYGNIFIELQETGDRIFVDSLIDIEPNRLDESFRSMLYQQTRSHPLFTIELLRGMQERGEVFRNESGEWTAISGINLDVLPNRIEAAIAERLDCLSAPLLKILKIASIEGESFTAEAISQLLQNNADEIRMRLSEHLGKRQRLVQPDSSIVVGSNRLSRYRFCHALIRKYLYETSDRVLRAHMHEKIGEALEALYGDSRDEYAGQLAYHFQEAAVPAKAIQYLLLAGRRAIRLSANEDAIAHLTLADSILQKLPHSVERDSQELSVLMTLSVPLMWTKGPAAPEVGQVCDRAGKLLLSVPETLELVPMLFQLGGYHGLRADFAKSEPLMARTNRLAELSGDPQLVIQAHWGLGYARLRTGQLEAGLSHLLKAAEEYDFERDKPLAYAWGYDPGVACLTWVSWALWALGYPDQALARSRAAIELSDKTAHPASKALALAAGSFLHALMRDSEGALSLSKSGLEPALEFKLPFYVSVLEFVRGLTLVRQGSSADGPRIMHSALQSYVAMGTRDLLPTMHILVAEAYAEAGNIGAASEAFAHAAYIAQGHEERFFSAELSRMKGELILSKSNQNFHGAELCFQEALSIAREQKAKILELRASVSLGKLWLQKNRVKEARSLIEGIFRWFTEGHGIPDLIEAKALLKAPIVD
jgi:DNA-binding SARP family transcriptional activator/predicted ATPase